MFGLGRAGRNREVDDRGALAQRGPDGARANIMMTVAIGKTVVVAIFDPGIGLLYVCRGATAEFDTPAIACPSDPCWIWA